MPDVLNPACTPRIISVTNSCGGALSRGDIDAFTPSKIAALGMDELGALTTIANAAEAKALGIAERGMAALLRGTVRDIKPMMFTEKVGMQSLVVPFIQRPQRAVINANYWKISAGVANAGAGSNGVPASAWNLTLDIGEAFAGYQGSPDEIHRYFLPGNSLFVETWDGESTKVARTLEFTIFNSVAAGTSATVTVVAPFSTDVVWGALSAAQKAVYQPTFGVAMVGTNSTSDYESWCYNQPIPYSKKLIVDWLQDSRESFCVDDEYKRMIDAIFSGKINPYQMNFNYSPLAEQRRIAQQQSENAWYNSVFYGTPIDENQTPDSYKLMPQIVDPEDGTTVLGYKARAEGIFTKLNNCSRVLDLEGAALDLNSLFTWLYQLRQHRAADGDTVDRISCLTDLWTKNLIFDTMSKYYLARYGVGIEKHYSRGEKLSMDNWVAFEFDVYDIPEAGCQLEVAHDDFFTHRFNQFNRLVGSGGDVDFGPRGRCLWFLDWTDIRVGDGGSKSVTRTWPKPEVMELYKCRMAANSKEYVLKRKTWTVMIDRPHRHLIVHNFSGTCPTVTVPTCTVPNPIPEEPEPEVPEVPEEP